MKFILKGKNANAFMVVGYKESLKDLDRKLLLLQRELQSLAPEAPLRVEEAIRFEISKKEAERANLLETIHSLESKC